MLGSMKNQKAIYLPPYHHLLLSRLAKRRGEPMAMVLRKLIVTTAKEATIDLGDATQPPKEWDRNHDPIYPVPEFARE